MPHFDDAESRTASVDGESCISVFCPSGDKSLKLFRSRERNPEKGY